MAQFALPLAMTVVGGAVSAGISALTQPKMPGPVGAPDPNSAAAAASREDALRKRRGSGANVLTGAGGAEANTPGAKVLLGQ